MQSSFQNGIYIFKEVCNLVFLVFSINQKNKANH